jgi:hypothetical protein
MSTATLGISSPLAETKTASKASKSLFARFYDALIEARMRQAMRELALHRHLLPDNVAEPGSAFTADGRLPR